MTEVAVVIVKTIGQRTLLLQRSPTTVFSLQWCHPGGKIEKDEDPQDAAVRELVEETGIVIPQNLFVKYCERTIKNHRFHYFDTDCLVDISQDLILRNSEHCGYGWFSSNEMLHLSMTEPSRRA